jgi:hypothetical protein
MPYAADPWAVWWHGPDTDRVGCLQDCPYGKPGDRLWVRETWHTHACFDSLAPRDITARSIHYAADGPCDTGKTRVSIHMPRWASRITPQITGVRVERLQDISEDNALAEGVERSPEPYPCWGMGGGSHMEAEAQRRWESKYSRWHRDRYRELWESINGDGSWALNPWVWVIEFKVVKS